MIIKFVPQRRDETLQLSKAADVLTVNGLSFDFSPLPDGATLPECAIDSVWFQGDVERIDGALHIKLLLPHAANPPDRVLYPELIEVLKDGPIDVPC